MKIDSFELSTPGSEVEEEAGIGDYAFDLLAAPFRGVEGLAQGIYNLGDWATFDLLPDWDERFLGTSKTMPASFLEGAVQFAIPFGVIGKGLSYAGKAAKAGKATGLVGKAGKALTKKGTGKFTDLNFKGYLASEMVTDFVAFDGQEQRLSNLIQAFPDLQNPVTEYLAADPSDSEAWGRVKNVLEGALIGLGVGAVLKPFMAGLNAIKRRKSELANGAENSDAVTTALMGYGDEMKDAPLPKAPQKAVAETLDEPRTDQPFDPDKPFDVSGLDDAPTAPKAEEPQLSRKTGDFAFQRQSRFDKEGKLIEAKETPIEPTSVEFKLIEATIKTLLKKGRTNSEIITELARKGFGGGIVGAEMSLRGGPNATFSFDNVLNKLRNDDKISLQESIESANQSARDAAKKAEADDAPTAPKKLWEMSKEEFESPYATASSEDTVIMYHRTSQQHAERIKKEGLKKGEDDVVWLTEKPDTNYKTGALIEIEIKKADIANFDARGRKGWKVTDKDISPENIKNIHEVADDAKFDGSYDALRSNPKVSAKARKAVVKAAVERGEQVPENVLKDFPDLGADAPTAPKTLDDKVVSDEYSSRIDEYVKKYSYRELQKLAKERGVKATNGASSIARRLVDQDFPEGSKAQRRELIRKGHIKPTEKDLQELNEADAPTAPKDVAYHGTPYTFKAEEGAPLGKFQSSNLGTGRGGQEFGKGFYFSSKREVAERYRETQSTKGSLYKVELAPKENEYLYWDKTLEEHPKELQDKLYEILKTVRSPFDKNPADKLTGENIHGMIVDHFEKTDPLQSATNASILLKETGIPGIRFLEDRFSASAGKSKEDYNYVIFSEDDINITESLRPKTPTKEPTQQPVSKLPTQQTEETVNKVLSHPLNTGGTQAIKRTGSGVMKRSLDDGSHVWESTIDGGIHQNELNQLLEAGAEKLDAEGIKPATQSKDKVEEGAIIEMADATGADGDTLKGLIKASGEDRVTQARIANRMYALRSFIGANGQDLIEAAELYAKQEKDGITDEALEAKIKSMMDTQLHLQARVSEIASGFGAGLRSTQFKAKIGLSPKELANQKLRQEYLRQRGGMSINTIVNKLILAKEGKGDDLWSALADVNKTVRGVEGGKFMNMVREYYINSLLWGPRTGVVNFLGNSIASNILQFERYLGGWLSADRSLRDGVINSWSYGLLSKDLWSFFSKAWKAGDSLLDAGGSTFKGDAGNERAVGSISGENVGQAIDNLRGTQGALENKDAFKGFIDWFGNLVRIPSKFLVSTDELYKQMAYRRRASAQLWKKAVDKGLTDPEAIGKYVAETMEGLVTNAGRHFSESSLIKDAQEVASKQDFENAVDREKFIAGHVEQARGEKLNFARQQGLVDSEDDISALKQLSDEWVEPNLEAAREATFTNELGPITSGLQTAVSKVPFGYVFLPFIKAPTNILKFSFGRLTAPAQMIGGATAQKLFPGLTKNRDMFIDKLKSDNPVVKAEAIGKMATGVVMQTALISTLYAFKDKITGGGPVDYRQKRVWEAAGYRPYSIKVGDTWVSYQRLDPIATIIGVYADLFDVADDSMHGVDSSAIERVGAAVAITLARNVTNKSYLTGVEQFVNLLSNPETKAEQAMGRIASGFIPNILYQGQSITGDQELKEIRSLGDAIYKKLPFGNERLDLKRNLLGEPYKAEMLEAGPLEILNPFNPIAFSTKTGDPILNEMANMHHGFSQPPTKLNGIVDLTTHTQGNGRTAYDRLLGLQSEVTISNRTLRQTLEKLISSKQYRSLDPRSNPGLPSPRVALINRVLNRYKQKALSELFREFPEIKQEYIQSGNARQAYKQGASQENVLSLLNQ